MKPEEIKARNEWFKSMHLRPVYLVEEDGGMEVGEKTGKIAVYIAIAPTNMRGRSTRNTQLSLVPAVDERRLIGRFVSYKNRGSIFPWDDIETATEVCFKSQVAAKIEHCREIYGAWKDEEEV